MTSRPEPDPRWSVAATLSRAGWRMVTSVDGFLSRSGPAFRRLTVVNSAATAGDLLVAVALAGTLFFTVPSAEARGNVLLYLLITLAPFAVLAPALSALLARRPTAYRHGLVTSSGLRGVCSVLLAWQLRTLWLYPLAFLLLVLSRLFAISRASLLPAALPGPAPLVAANARLAQVAMVAGGVAVPVGGAGLRLAGPEAVLGLAAIVYGATAVAANDLPPPPRDPGPRGVSAGSVRHRSRLPRAVRLAQLATAGVRLLNGFLLLLLAFALRRADAGLLDFGALLGAAGGGYLVAALVSPWLERRLREEPTVVVGLAVEAGAAFVAAQAFGLVAAGALAAAAGLAWGLARFAFDGLLQAAVPPTARGAAFTRSETLFALAWVLGAVVPVAVPVPARLGLTSAGVAALAAQVVYVTGLLVPRRQEPSLPAGHHDAADRQVTPS
ncbi:MAG TPA: hypothetical protein VHF25_04585 [Nitriliruptorales bacterium]|nr:hypothetical protein [Nitriliruptorales bacterium]